MPVEVRDLKIESADKRVYPVKDVFLRVGRGRRVCLVGESGSGKSLTALSLLRILPEGLKAEGEIFVDGIKVLSLKGEELRKYRWETVSMVFQDPSASLNPLLKVKEQVGEAIKYHFPNVSKCEIEDKVVELLKKAEVPYPERVMESYPHHLSGGLKQRVCIAMALSCSPKYLIADEPTTALDVTVQRRILELLERLSEEEGVGILLITHDMGVVAEFAQEVYVMYAGYVVEYGKVEEVFSNPLHPYTEALLKCSPKFAGKPKRKLPSIPGFVLEPSQKLKGCPFFERCPIREEVCRETPPPKKWREKRFVLCHLR